MNLKDSPEIQVLSDKLQNSIKDSPKSPAPSEDEYLSSFSDSDFSTRHLTDQDKAFRKSTTLLTCANVTKMFIGITMISVS